MYFITTLERDFEGTRCVGYFSKLEDAVEAVINNYYDLNEAGYYPYAVIENIPEGIYHYDENPIWFKYDKNTNKYIQIDQRPVGIEEYMIGFGIG